MSLLLDVIFGAIGGVYVVLGRREHDPLYLAIGAALMFYPYFVSNIFVVIAVGAVLTAIPIARARGLL